MIYTGSKALQFLSIPVFTIFKNLTIILTAYSERYLLSGSPVTRLMLVSFGLIVASSVVAGWADITAGKTLRDSSASVVVAYGWMALNSITTTSYMLFLKSRLKSTGFKDFDTVFYNNLLSVPTLVVLSLLTEIPEATRLYERYYGPNSDVNASEFYGLTTGILVSSVSSFGISYSTSWCMRVTSSTTYSIVGALNKLPIAIAGMVFFDAVVNFASVSGVALAFFGGIVYSLAKAQQSAAAPKPIPLPAHTRLAGSDDDQ
nr:GDP-mannose transporter into the lumen of the Golgi [Polyrhizophydium stewartii]